MSEQRPNDASVAGKVAMVAAAATAATNMTKPQRDRESVVGAAFWITVIFFWFRAIYMYIKYVMQWSEVQELGIKGRVWKAIWPLVAAASPLFVIKFMAVGRRSPSNLVAFGRHNWLPTRYAMRNCGK